MADTILWEVETTDATYDGAGWSGNYCWVRREEVTLPANLTDRQTIAALRKIGGLNGSKAKTESFGEGYVWKHPGAAILTFALPCY
jgi:hypothetical protein